MLGNLPGDVPRVVEHHLDEHGLVERLAVLKGQQDGRDAVLAEAA